MAKLESEELGAGSWEQMGSWNFFFVLEVLGKPNWEVLGPLFLVWLWLVNFEISGYLLWCFFMLLEK